MKPLLDEIADIFNTQTFTSQREAAQAAIDVVERRLLSDEYTKIMSDTYYKEQQVGFIYPCPVAIRAATIKLWQAVKGRDV